MRESRIYAEKGIQYEDDPYYVVRDNPSARPFLKHFLLCLLNADDETKAEKAANYWLYNNHKEREQLKTIGITKAKPLIRAFKEAHEPINEYFCNGKDTGLRIMNKDSKIALDVVDHFAKKNIPILAIHDSFLVQERYERQLKSKMFKAYKENTNGFRCQIKK